MYYVSITRKDMPLLHACEKSGRLTSGGHQHALAHLVHGAHVGRIAGVQAVHQPLSACCIDKGCPEAYQAPGRRLERQALLALVCNWRHVDQLALQPVRTCQ